MKSQTSSLRRLLFFLFPFLFLVCSYAVFFPFYSSCHYLPLGAQGCNQVGFPLIWKTSVFFRPELTFHGSVDTTVNQLSLVFDLFFWGLVISLWVITFRRIRRK